MSINQEQKDVLQVRLSQAIEQLNALNNEIEPLERVIQDQVDRLNIKKNDAENLLKEIKALESLTK